MGIGLLVGSVVGAVGGGIVGESAGAIIGSIVGATAGTAIDNWSGDDENGWFGFGGSGDEETSGVLGIGSEYSEDKSEPIVDDIYETGAGKEESEFEDVGGEGSVGETGSGGAGKAVRGTIAGQGPQTFGNGGFGFTSKLGA